MSKLDIYQNTPENRKKVGWNRVPEHCIGDSTKPYVWHDLVHGKFWFIDTAEKFQLEIENEPPATCRHCDNPPLPGIGNCAACAEEVGGDY